LAAYAAAQVAYAADAERIVVMNADLIGRAEASAHQRILPDS
jgi:hypothetical protein